MLRHLVFFKFHPHVEAEAISDLEQSLGALPEAIAEINGFEFGRDVLRTERSYDLALIVTFADQNALQRYQVHPAHLVVIGKVRKLCSSVIAVDFKI